MNLHPKTNHKRVSSHSGTPLGIRTSHGHFGLLDSPRPELGGSHHLPPYNILCSSLPRLHPNGLFFQDSQVGVPKLSRVGIMGLWTATAPRPELGSGRVLNQSCSSRWKLSNTMLHSSRQRREGVDSWFLVVGSQTASLTPDPSFAHNLAADVWMANARPFSISTFQDLSNETKNTSMQGVLGLAVEL
jgi:hypothetical protein